MNNTSRKSSFRTSDLNLINLHSRVCDIVPPYLTSGWRSMLFYTKPSSDHSCLEMTSLGMIEACDDIRFEATPGSKNRHYFIQKPAWVDERGDYIYSRCTSSPYPYEDAGTQGLGTDRYRVIVSFRLARFSVKMRRAKKMHRASASLRPSFINRTRMHFTPVGRHITVKVQSYVLDHIAHNNDLIIRIECLNRLSHHGIVLDQWAINLMEEYASLVMANVATITSEIAYVAEYEQ